MDNLRKYDIFLDLDGASIFLPLSAKEFNKINQHIIPARIEKINM
jgi:hypothetical protein